MTVNLFRFLALLCLLVTERAHSEAEHRYLYVAEPGIRDYVQYGGHGLIVFDIDHQHQFVKRIPTAGVDTAGKPLNVKGICANAKTQRLYVTSTKTLQCLDLVTDKMLWEKSYTGGCDRMALSPDGQTMYLPSLEGPHWNVVEALTGKLIKPIVLDSAAHNTIYGPDGKSVYLGGRRSHLFAVAETRHHTVSQKITFSNNIRPFTINGRQTLCFVNVDDLLGFEVGDLVAGKMIHRVEVEGFKAGPTKRHGCPAHGIGLTPDEKELWLTDSFNRRMHIYDATVMPPKLITSIPVRDEPGWITFSIDGKLAYPSTGDIIDVASRKIIGGLKDENGLEVQSEKLLEIDFKGKKPIRAGNQFGMGQR